MAAILELWKLLYLDAERSSAVLIGEIVGRVTTARHRAYLEYEKLLVRYPSAASVLRTYASFFQDVLNDNAAAHNLVARAEVVETAEVARADGGQELSGATADVLAPTGTATAATMRKTKLDGSVLGKSRSEGAKSDAGKSDAMSSVSGTNTAQDLRLATSKAYLARVTGRRTKTDAMKVVNSMRQQTTLGLFILSIITMVMFILEVVLGVRGEAARWCTARGVQPRALHALNRTSFLHCTFRDCRMSTRRSLMQCKWRAQKCSPWLTACSGCAPSACWRRPTPT
ncbi:hypothetical protein EON62_01635 [archaeon]|nr:MAG: hypothetical protein EON62_01635 [archaeon]